MLLLLQCLHTVRVPPILLYRHYSPDQLISRTRGPITRDLSVHGDPNVNPKWNNMSAISWTSMHTASNRSTALPKLWQSFFLSQMWAKLQTPAMESGDGKFCGCADGDWTRVSSGGLVEYIQTHYQLKMVARHRLTVRIFQQYSEIPQRNWTSRILKCSESTVKQVQSCSISEQSAV